jgi:hypothetical protein
MQYTDQAIVRGQRGDLKGAEIAADNAASCREEARRKSELLYGWWHREVLMR